MFNCGQRRIYNEGEKPAKLKHIDCEPVEIVEVPALEIHPKYMDKHFVVMSDVTEMVPGVEAKMVDWFWANMEKGYLLWAPGEHYGFDWIVPPCQVGYEGSVEGSYEFDPANVIKITRIGMQHYPFTECYEHCWISCFTGDPAEGFLIHMYQDVPGGIYWRSVSVSSEERLKKMMASGGRRPEIAPHMAYESARLNKFLPQLYDLWKDHPDPWQNMHFDLTTTKNEDGTWKHVSKNLPPKYEDYQ